MSLDRRHTFDDTMRQADPDTVMVELAKAGQTSAFDDLYGRHHTKILRLALSITHNAEDAEDVIQETFLKAYKNLSTFRGTARFSTWLHRIALNQGLMHIRARRRTMIAIDQCGSNDESFQTIDLYDWRPNPEQFYAAVELSKQLHHMIGRLPNICRATVVLRYAYELSIQDIATCLGISAAAVKSRLLRARRTLRERILPQRPEASNLTGNCATARLSRAVWNAERK